MFIRAKRVLGTLAMAAVAALAIATVPATGHAQQNDGADMAQGETPDFSQPKLEAYADAVVEVSQLVAKWQPRIQSAQQEQDKAKVQELQQQANAELVKVVQDADGITLDEYKEISQAVRQDKELYDQLQGMVEDRRGE
jgi:hypothetical protein